jgi:hypothetical protein
MNLRLLRPILLCLPLAACSIVIGGRVETCGEHPADGGPAVIVTKDQEICEMVRVRVARAIEEDPEITYARVDELREKSLQWEREKTFDGLVAAVRRDAGDLTADAMRSAVDAVLAQSKRPLPADHGDVERCLVKGAMKGLNIALLNVRPWAPATPTAPAAEEK